MKQDSQNKTREQTLANIRRVVVKIGSALITRNGLGVSDAVIAPWAKQIAELRAQGIEVVLVSSGAVAEGMSVLEWKERPQSVQDLQAAAAVGQMNLVQRYQKAFENYNLNTAQVLLTHADLSNRQRYLNARSTLQSLLAHNVLPVVNENDVVATDEIRFGDNDRLAAMVASLVDADLLLILTDQEGLFDKDPRNNADAKLIQNADPEDKSIDAMASGGKGALGTGGMLTKVLAARMAASSGAATVIASGSKDNIICQAVKAEAVGTFFAPTQEVVASRKQWLSNQLTVKGSLSLDKGAVEALQSQGKSLLPIGIAELDGEFMRGDLVECLNQAGQVVARGLVNYSADECQKIKGQASQEIQTLLGYAGAEEVVHRDNLVLVK